MKHDVGFWIDHKKAVIVAASAAGVTTTTLDSEVGSHARYSARPRNSTGDGPHEGGGEKRHEQRNDEHLARYYDAVIGRLGQPQRLLIFGPGEAKLQLEKRLGPSHGRPERVVDIETADTLTDPQIVAKLKEHFGIAV